MAGISIVVHYEGITGGELLEAILAAVRRGIAAAVRPVAARLEAELRRVAPVRTGRLRASISVRGDAASQTLQVFAVFYFNPVNARIGLLDRAIRGALPDILRLLRSAIQAELGRLGP